MTDESRISTTEEGTEQLVPDPDELVVDESGAAVIDHDESESSSQVAPAED